MMFASPSCIAARWQDHRERRSPGGGVECHDHRLQRPPRPGARAMAQAQGVEIRTCRDRPQAGSSDIQAAMVGMLAPEYEEEVCSPARPKVREIFRVPIELRGRLLRP